MSNPSLDDVVAMDATDFANFAATYTPEEASPAGEVSASVDGGDNEQATPNPPATPEGEAPETPEVPEVVADPDAANTPPENNPEEINPEASNEGLEPEAASSFYEKLTAPMKANGKEYTFNDPEEIRTLMQKGIGFEKRMGGLKKFQRQITALDKEGLLENEDTINLIIDLAKGKPEALKQYIENNRIDVYDVIGLDSTGYTPTKHVATEEVFEQAQVVQEIQAYDGYELIKPIAEETWDEQSREVLLAKPDLARNMINAAKAGIHDMIVTEAEKVKLLASSPMTDLDAYIQAGDKLHKSGAFDKIAKRKSNVSDANTIQPTNVAPQKKQTQRKPAAPTMADVAKLDEEGLRQFAAEHGI